MPKRSLSLIPFIILLKPKSQGIGSRTPKPRFESPYVWRNVSILKHPNNPRSALLGGAHVRRFETAVFLFLIWPRNAVAARCGGGRREGDQVHRQQRRCRSLDPGGISEMFPLRNGQGAPCTSSPWVNIQRETSNKSASPSLLFAAPADIL